MNTKNAGNLLLPMLFLAFCLGACSRQSSQEPVPPHESFTIASVEMSEPRLINVYLPPDYNADQAVVYPVIYMPDGGLAEDFPHIANTIDAGIRAGEMRPVVLVGIENTQRRRDMTGPTEVEEDRKIAPVVGGSAAFRAFIANELIPQVQARYRVTDEAGIIGESAAGLFIVETFFLTPDLFDVYLAISPSLWWNDHELVRKAAERLAADPGLEADLYLTSANETDIAPHVAQLAEILDQSAPAGLDWQYVPRPDLRHNNIYRAVAPGLLRQMYPAGK